MAVIKFTTRDSRTVEAVKDEKDFGTIKFEGFFRNNISAVTKGNTGFDFVRSGFWGDKFEFRQAGEVFLYARILPFKKMVIEDAKTGSKFILKQNSFFKYDFEMTGENDLLFCTIKVKRGFRYTIKNAVFESAGILDNYKEQFLICAAAFLLIKARIKRNSAAAV